MGNSPRRSLVLFLAGGLGALAGRAALPADGEPPLELTLEVGGQTVDIELDRPFEVSIEGRVVPMKLVAKPTRHFRFGGIEFDYPRHLSFSVANESGVLIWSLDGNDCLLMVQSYPPMNLDELLPLIVESTAEQYGEARIEETEVSLTLAGKKVDGRRLAVTLAGTRLRQDFYGVATGDASLVLVVQDSPSQDGSPTPETREATALLERTFRLSR